MKKKFTRMPHKQAIDKGTDATDSNLKQTYNKIRLKPLCTIIVVVVLLLLLQLVGANWQFDITPQTIMTTGEVTRGLLNRLDRDVEIIVLDSRTNFTAYNSFVSP
ncbi:MAG TPA: hypothetical protein GX717_06370, partial [Clostridiaceae bacterium]|nr:hypothetical protein [Clostridiaceae bacterium]